MQNCWTILADRAKSQASDAHAIVLSARAKVTQFEANAAHIKRLHDDYVARFAISQKEAHMIGDNLAYRKFLDHLQGLAHRVAAQLSAANKELADAKKYWADTERERVKMESMVEREARNTAATKAKREQRQIDETGIMLFNLR